MGETRIVLIERDPQVTQLLQDLLGADQEQGFQLDHAEDLDQAMARLPQRLPDVILFGLAPANEDGLAGIRRLTQTFPTVPILVLVPEKDSQLVAEACKAGAFDYLETKEADPRLWERTVRYAVERGRIKKRLLLMEEELERKNNWDPLTGLLNRRGIERSLLRELHQCRSNGQQLLVLLVDLDNFSQIRSSLDHGIGNAVLQIATERIRSVIRATDEMGRAGDDQFLVLLPGLDAAQGLIIAERIRASVARGAFEVEDISLWVTSSIGVTTVPENTLGITEVLARAHVALHRSKAEGKNQIACTLEGDEERGEGKPLVLGSGMVESLLCENVFRVAWQPIVDLKDQELVSREMLIRGPKGDLEEPFKLFDFSAEREILTPVDLLCLKKCVAVAQQVGGQVPFHVNIFPATLLEARSEGLVKLLAEGFGPGQCCLEIDKSQIQGDLSGLVGAISPLREAKVRLAIDGVGFDDGNWETWEQLQPEILKIDKRLVRELTENRDKRKKLKGFLRSAKKLGAEVIAAGVETLDELKVLQDCGVSYGQGFLFGKPAFFELPEEELGPSAEPAKPFDFSRSVKLAKKIRRSVDPEPETEELDLGELLPR
jgi:diguanylate cyclase (GGDEF)-like protein